MWYSVVLMTTVVFPLWAVMILIESSFRNLLIANRCNLVVLGCGILACLRHHFTLDFKSCDLSPLMLLAIDSVLAMMSVYGIDLGEMEKLSPRESTSSSILSRLRLL